MNEREQYIGQRLREIRKWRRLSLTAVAELSGISIGHLSKIERGQRPISKRSTLEMLAQVLRVSPEELTGTPYAPVDPLSSEAHAALAAVETALDAHDLGVDPGVALRPWQELRAAVRDLYEGKWAEADFAAQGAILPELLAELHAAYVRDPEHRPAVLAGLIYAYRSVAGVAKFLGARALPPLAALRAQICAEELDSPEWMGFAAFIRGFAGSLSQPHQYSQAVRAAERVQDALNGSNAIQVAGALHLNAALISAAQENPDQARDHLAEAIALARRLPAARDNFGYLHFGPEHVGVWQVSLGVELGEGAKVAEYVRVPPEIFPGKARQAAFYADLGRGLIAERKTMQRGIQALAQAERIAPQLIRNNPFVREAVTNLLMTTRRDAGGRELRGLAYRMGVAPTV
ncbi:hypothetical protein ALI144C_16945 [Actinosynnema sp. ALI-1.44]|uniref:helix-turn-helix domain-containing protein n=1 Tax=Actinosynnema sp. ALI-1.44 TaxID=1933779 RepID=UPI00097C0546|nr:helix-turn-helix transcriptional regulator [Actinosynnema sp. ALI-1.44]ONI83225.1 hypothetical protein ALI144C_16945 [Actinosynnema sp. ALI-1.44]